MKPNPTPIFRRAARLLLGLSLVLGAACGPKAITPLQRKQAASYVSEANFAVTLRDYPRAEGLLAQAVEACPDVPEYWLTLGTVRRKMDNRAGARTAYERALKTARAAAKRTPATAQPVLQQVYVLAVLGRTDEARKTLAKARQERPEDRTIRMFVEGKELDRLLAEPGFKELMP